MYSFKLDQRFLNKEEMSLFESFLVHHGLDNSIWDIFECFFHSSLKGTVPYVLRAYDDLGLCGAAFLIKCSKYGRALFNNIYTAKIINIIGIPFFLWIKFGCCMDMISNPGFVKDPEKEGEIYAEMAKFLKKSTLLTLICDYSDKEGKYPEPIVLPALPHALIDTADMDDVSDYISGHKNIKRKMNIFNNVGGKFEIISNKLDEETVRSVKKCFLSTAEKSIMYLPYQEIYLNSALNTSSTRLDNVYYFIARLDGKFLGYQAAIKTGKHLNALHGAFDRDRETTYHAYDVLFVKMVEFAVENGLKSIDFGAVINTTKQRAVNKTLDMSYYIYSKYAFVQRLFEKFLKMTKI